MHRLRLILIAAVTALPLAACEKALFPENTPRTPFDRYAVLRGQSRPATRVNAFGVEEPALRERLRPLEGTSDWGARDLAQGGILFRGGDARSAPPAGGDNPSPIYTSSDNPADANN